MVIIHIAITGWTTVVRKTNKNKYKYKLLSIRTLLPETIAKYGGSWRSKYVFTLTYSKFVGKLTVTKFASHKHTHKFC